MRTAPPVPFPPGLTTRGATLTDAAAIAEVVAAAETAAIGETFVTEDDVIADMASPDRDNDLDMLLVFDGDQLVAYGEIPDARGDGEVHPSHRGRGIGSAVAAWMEARCVDRTAPGAEARIGQTKHDARADVAELFQTRGYEIRHTSWILGFSSRADIPARTVAGAVIRPFAAGEEEAVYQVVEDAFNEWLDRTPTTFEAWKAKVISRPDFVPDMLRVAIVNGEIAGVCFALRYDDEGWVDQVAVRVQDRRIGLAQALLADTYSALAEQGCTRFGLSTDSRTGALDLYLKLGMRVDHSFSHWSKLLRPAAN